MSGPAVASASFDAADSGVDYQGYTTVTSTPGEVDVNLAGVCGTTDSSTCHLDQPNGYIDVSSVPQPATWAFMIGGLGLVGAAMRRRGQVMAPI